MQLTARGVATVTKLNAAHDADGALDPDGGLVLASALPAAASVQVAFDGTRWLAAVLTADGGSLYDLYGVHVATDDTPLDPTPVLLAGGVSSGAASISGRPGGGFLIAIARPAGTGLLGVDVLAVP